MGAICVMIGFVCIEVNTRISKDDLTSLGNGPKMALQDMGMATLCRTYHPCRLDFLSIFISAHIYLMSVAFTSLRWDTDSDHDRSTISCGAVRRFLVLSSNMLGKRTGVIKPMYSGAMMKIASERIAYVALGNTEEVLGRVGIRITMVSYFRKR